MPQAFRDEFIRRIILVVLVISLLVFAANILATLFATGRCRLNLRRLPFQRARHRPNLLMGGERARCLPPRCSVPAWP